MKIIHLCTIDFGGAAVAAQRLHLGLLRQGVESSILFVTVSNPQQFPNKFKVDEKGRLTIATRIKRKLGIPINQKEKNRLMVKGFKGQYEIFSFPFTDLRVEDHPLVVDADIVNLHWVSNFINYPTFFKKIRKPIVWTLHDMNPLLGGFHYEGDLERNRAIFGRVEELLKVNKMNALREVSNLTIITPSKWLGEKLILNEVLHSKGYTCIPYGLDTTIFKPHDKSFARSVFNLPSDKKIILFVSENIHNYRKGFDLLTSAIETIDSDKNTLIVTIGKGNIESTSDITIIALANIYDERLLSLLYSAADIFVLPSREDNFPNVMLEALSCGTPVIAFNNGGMSEVINNHDYGILLSEINAEALKKALNHFIQGDYNFDRNKIRKFAVAHFDLHIQAGRYIQIYSKILARDADSNPGN